MQCFVIYFSFVVLIRRDVCVWTFVCCSYSRISGGLSPCAFIHAETRFFPSETHQLMKGSFDVSTGGLSS